MNKEELENKMMEINTQTYRFLKSIDRHQRLIGEYERFCSKAMNFCVVSFVLSFINLLGLFYVIFCRN